MRMSERVMERRLFYRNALEDDYIESMFYNEIGIAGIHFISEYQNNSNSAAAVTRTLCTPRRSYSKQSEVAEVADVVVAVGNSKATELYFQSSEESQRED